MHTLFLSVMESFGGVGIWASVACSGLHIILLDCFHQKMNSIAYYFSQDMNLSPFEYSLVSYAFISSDIFTSARICIDLDF
jgi:hypothetical protein